MIPLNHWFNFWNFREKYQVVPHSQLPHIFYESIKLLLLNSKLIQDWLSRDTVEWLDFSLIKSYRYLFDREYLFYSFDGRFHYSIISNEFHLHFANYRSKKRHYKKFVSQFSCMQIKFENLSHVQVLMMIHNLDITSDADQTFPYSILHFLTSWIHMSSINSTSFL